MGRRFRRKPALLIGCDPSGPLHVIERVFPCEQWIVAISAARVRTGASPHQRDRMRVLAVPRNPETMECDIGRGFRGTAFSRK